MREAILRVVRGECGGDGSEGGRGGGPGGWDVESPVGRTVVVAVEGGPGDASWVVLVVVSGGEGGAGLSFWVVLVVDASRVDTSLIVVVRLES